MGASRRPLHPFTVAVKAENLRVRLPFAEVLFLIKWYIYNIFTSKLYHMPFEKGNTHGNRFNAGKQPTKRRGKGKFTSIVEELRALADQVVTDKTGAKRTRQQALALVIWNKAINGDPRAIELITERFDGRTPEEIKHTMSGTLNTPMGGGATINIITNG